MKNVLHVDSVLYAFDEKHLLTDIFLKCQQHEVIGLLGRNGSGKSTLMKIIHGSIRAERSFVRVNDVVLKSLSDRYGIIRYLPQNSFLPHHTKIKSLIELYCAPPEAEKIMAIPTFQNFLDQSPKLLSFGEQRLLEILILLHSRSDFLLLDEPFNGLSPLLIEEVKRQIVLASKTKGLIVTDHDYQDILDIATRTFVLFNGSLKEITVEEELVNWGYVSKSFSN